MSDAIPLPPVDPPPPAELAWLMRLVGPEMTLRMVELYGGTRVFVPKGAAPGQKLARELSPAAEAALVSEFGGTLILVPLAKAWRARVYSARGEGPNAIARRLVASVDTVLNYLQWGRDRLSRTDG